MAAVTRLVRVCRQYQLATNTDPGANIEKQLRIERTIADTNLVMQMRAVHPGGPAHFADNRSGHDIGALADGYLCQTPLRCAPVMFS